MSGAYSIFTSITLHTLRYLLRASIFKAKASGLWDLKCTNCQVSQRNECNGRRPWNGSVLTKISTLAITLRKHRNGNRSRRSQVVKSQAHW